MILNEFRKGLDTDGEVFSFCLQGKKYDGIIGAMLC